MQKCRFFVKWAGKVGLVWSSGVELAVSHHLQVRYSRLEVRAQGCLLRAGSGISTFPSYTRKFSFKSPRASCICWGYGQITGNLQVS